MPFVPFHEYFPEVAANETRGVFQPGPDGTLGEGVVFGELYCDEPGCDCRRVVFHVFAKGRLSEPLATLTFGWEPASFYRKWASFPLSAEDLEELMGPALMRLTPQSPRATEMLEHERTLLADPVYVERLIRHYRMFREVVDGKAAAGPKPRAAVSGWRSPSRKHRPRK